MRNCQDDHDWRHHWRGVPLWDSCCLSLFCDGSAMMDLFDFAKPKTRKDELEDAAKEFHRQHPKVWTLFVKFTREMVDRGFNHYSTNAIFERIRWETDQADSDGNSTFKLNNNHRSFYARWYMNAFPEHQGFFRLRFMTSKNEPAKDLPELTPKDFPYVNE